MRTDPLPAAPAWRAYFRAGDWLEAHAAPLADLAIRLAIFRVFFWSGLAKLGNWSGTLFLFETDYAAAAPWLPPLLAALLATAFELGASSLVLVGLLARLAALPLLGMAAAIQFGLGAADPTSFDKVEHYLWMALLLAVIVRGPGRWSLDARLAKR